MKLDELDAPFASEDIEWRIQQVGKNNNGIWAKVLAYVTNRAIMKRLDEVCGKAGWRNEYRDIPNNGGVECGISIKVEGEWITKWDAAENTQVEAVKGGRSGATRRCAMGDWSLPLQPGRRVCRGFSNARAWVPVRQIKRGWRVLLESTSAPRMGIAIRNTD